MINIDSLIKNATLSKDKVALNAYKNIKAEFQKVKTAKNYKGDWCDKLEVQIISKYARSLEDAISQFSQARRDDLVSEYTSELEVVRKLLPKPVNESEIYSFIINDKNFFADFWINESSYNLYWEEGQDDFLDDTKTLRIPKKEMGNAIKYLKSQFPTVDGKIISEIIKKHLV